MPNICSNPNNVENSSLNRARRTQMFNNLVSSSSYNHSILPTDENEIVRFLHAMYMYASEKDRKVNILSDLSYGFYPVRDLTWIHNKSNSLPCKTSLFDSHDEFNRIMLRVKTWSPNEFVMQDRLEYLQDHSIDLSPDFMSSYLQLLDLCIDDWWNNSKRLEIFDETNVEIFRKIIRGSSKYLNKNAFLNSIVEEYVFIQPPQRIVLDSPLTQNINNQVPASNEVELNHDSHALNIDLVQVPDQRFDGFEFTIDGEDINEMNFLDDSIIKLPNNDSIVEEPVDISKTIVRNIIFDSYRYKFFKKADLKNLFKDLSDEKCLELENIVFEMYEEKSFSEIIFNNEVVCKLNYLSERTGKYVKYELVLNSINRTLIKAAGSKAPAHKLRTDLTSNYRISSDEWSSYLEDLVVDSVLNKISEGRYEYYSLA